MSAEQLSEPCASCRGVCCGFHNEVRPVLELTSDEVEFLESSGTKIFEVEAPLIQSLVTYQINILIVATNGEMARKSAREQQAYMTTIFHGSYMLESPCGWGRRLPNGSVLCTANGNSARPEVCSKFTAGGDRCLKMKNTPHSD